MADLGRPKVGVVGCGSFGRLLLETIAPHAEIVCHDTDPAVLRRLDFPVAIDLAALAAVDILVLAVPVQAMATTLRALASHIRPSTLVIDTCSVKQGPVQAMRTLLPGHGELLGTHPLFGPQSAREGLSGSGIAIVPVCGEKWRGVARFLRNNLGLRLIVTTAEEHDREMAYVQGLTHMLARVVRTMRLPATAFGTRTYDHMRSIIDLVGQDSDDLFEAIMAENPYAADVYDEFVRHFLEMRDLVSGFGRPIAFHRKDQR